METGVIYADVFFLINFIIDFLCLYITRALVSAQSPLWRITVSAAFGGFYALAWAFMPGIPPWALIPSHIAAAWLMTFIMIGGKRFGRVCAACGVFCLSAALVGGALGAAFSLTGGGYVVSGGVYADISPLFLLGTAAFSVGACYVYGVYARRRISARSAVAVICAGGAEYRARLFVDTGFHVLDPLTGELVMIVSARVFGEKPPRAARIIPFSTAAGSRVLYGFKPQSCAVNGVPVQAVVAISGRDEYYRGCDGLVPPLLVFDANGKESGVC